jgi:hypothetical protein
MAIVTVVMFKPAVDEFRGWTGPIGQSIYRLAREGAFRQRALVGKKSGALAASIEVGRKGHGARGIEVDVGANALLGTRGRSGYAEPNDQGAMPHIIRPKRPGGMLVFFWAKVGREVEFRSVFHPGNRAHHWAEKGMAAAMAMWQRGG